MKIKHRMTFLFLVALASAHLGASSLGISLATWSGSASLASGQGIHASVGVFSTVTPHLEVEASLVVALSPQIGQDLLGSLVVSTPIAGPLYHRSGAGTLYYNGLVGLGYLGGWDSRHQRAVHAVGVRLVPFAIGGPYYSRRERALTVSVFYDIPSRRWSVSWSLLGFDLYL